MRVCADALGGCAETLACNDVAEVDVNQGSCYVGDAPSQDSCCLRIEALCAQLDLPTQHKSSSDTPMLLYWIQGGSRLQTCPPDQQDNSH